MAGSARVGQFGQPASIYGSFAPVVKPIDNVITPSAFQQVQDAAQAQTQLLLQQLQALQQQSPMPTAPTPTPPAPTPYQDVPPPVVPPAPSVKPEVDTKPTFNIEGSKTYSPELGYYLTNQAPRWYIDQFGNKVYGIPGQ